MNNIFKDAKFGDKFLTDKNVIAIYVNHGTKYHTLVLDKGKGFIYCTDNGDDFTNHETLYNIISRYQELIDEKKLDELSDNYYFNEEMESSGEFERIKNAYEAGYHKAKEE